MAGVLGILQALPTLEKISQNLAGAAPLGPHLVQAAGTLALSIIIATLMSLHGTGLLGSLVSMAAGVILGASASYALAESRAGSERVGEFDAQARRNLFLILQTVAKVQQRLDAMPVDEPAAAGVAGIVGTPQPAPPIAPARESSSSTIYSTNNITLDQLATQYLCRLDFSQHTPSDGPSPRHLPSSISLDYEPRSRTMRVLDTSAGRGNEELLMCAAQSGGDVELVLRARTGKALSVCAGNGGPELSQTEACVLWSSAKGCQVGRWSMESPAVLKCGEELRSPDGHYYLTPQMDGNVVFYDDTTWNKNPSEATRWFKWATRTDKKGTGAKLELRADGELIATNDRNEALWKASGYTPMAGYKYELVVGDGKTLILYRLARGGGAKEEVWRAKPMIIL